MNEQIKLRHVSLEDLVHELLGRVEKLEKRSSEHLERLDNPARNWAGEYGKS